MPTRIKRYEDRAEKLDSLLERVEREMGPEALLEVHNFRRGAFLGLIGGTKMVEVIATLKITHPDAGHPAKPLVPDIPRPVGRVEPPEPESGPEPEIEAEVEPEPVPVQQELPREQEPEPQPAQAEPKHTPPARPVDAYDLADVRDSITQLKSAVIEMAHVQQKALESSQVYAPTPAELEQQNLDAAKLAEISTSIVTLQSAVAELVQDAKSKPAEAGEPEPQLDPGELKDIRESIGLLQGAISQLAEQQQEEREARMQLDKTDELQRSIERDRKSLLEINQSVDSLKSTVRDFITDQREAAKEQARNRPVLEPASILPIIHRETYGKLLGWGVTPDDATGLIYQALEDHGLQLMSEEELQASIKSIICNRARIAEASAEDAEELGHVVSLVGATGVGKTTTISKLAAYFTFTLGKQVSLISLDNYRIAAAEQLRRYCDIIGLELDLVYTPEDYVKALEQRANSDLILVDTAGRSPRNALQVSELQEFYAARHPDEIHLVVSASTNADDLSTILDKFSPLNYNRIIVSKLDETYGAGCIHNLTRFSSVPLSYFTIGQNVPEDIRRASTAFIREWFNLPPAAPAQ